MLGNVILILKKLVKYPLDLNSYLDLFNRQTLPHHKLRLSAESIAEAAGLEEEMNSTNGKYGL